MLHNNRLGKIRVHITQAGKDTCYILTGWERCMLHITQAEKIHVTY